MNLIAFGFHCFCFHPDWYPVWIDDMSAGLDGELAHKEKHASIALETKSHQDERVLMVFFYHFQTKWRRTVFVVLLHKSPLLFMSHSWLIHGHSRSKGKSLPSLSPLLRRVINTNIHEWTANVFFAIAGFCLVVLRRKGGKEIKGFIYRNLWLISANLFQL